MRADQIERGDLLLTVNPYPPPRGRGQEGEPTGERLVLVTDVIPVVRERFSYLVILGLLSDGQPWVCHSFPWMNLVDLKLVSRRLSDRCPAEE